MAREGKLDYTLFRPFNWIGPGLDNLHSAKEGSSRVITQFLGHIVRGEPIKLVDGGSQKRCFTGISDGIDALMKIIENRNGCATRKIFNVGNPRNNYSVRELAEQLLKLAAEYPEYRANAAKVTLVDTTAGEYYGSGYQDVAESGAEDRRHAHASWAGNRALRCAKHCSRSSKPIAGSCHSLRICWTRIGPLKAAKAAQIKAPASC